MKNAIYSLLIFGLLLISCKQSTKNTDKNDIETSEAVVEVVQKEEVPAYDRAKGGHLVGSQMTKMLGDTLGIIMYEFTMEPGDTVGLHSHPKHTVYVLEGGTIAVYWDGTEKQIMELPAGEGFVSPPASDAAVNVGETTIKLLTVDIYE
ncbi:hypothetical protein OOZ15_09620 [Galbibacter sp. EGI 63066]|uniref:cupin domain-containing protein n=1 Tax=Galbibacter sp. EGI 63066 TaxID=2993559 RepID=UPI0022496539|nr:hypothetical protein [Galbibacter sp. EGI 63066]MCX2680195.1 hypothetical protein [Galbibacter sp. EGI 63066]